MLGQILLTFLLSIPLPISCFPEHSRHKDLPQPNVNMAPTINSALNFKAVFTQEVTPFKIEVDQDFLDTTRLKVSLTRFVDDLEEQKAFTDGPPRQDAEKVADYWANEYDWRAIEADINSKLSQYTTLVETPTTNFTGPIPLHFVHHRSPREDAIPLLFVHGWPGSFLEVDNIIRPLTNPPDPSLPAFHVVAPSIPGYGFSPSPGKPGFGYRQSGAAFHALMQKLGYNKYVFQGGDAGDLINRYMAVDFPENVVSGHSNFWIIPPNEDDLDKYRRNESSSDEQYLIELYGGFTTSGWAYGQIQQTRPLKLAAAMTDSPVGLAMWIYDSVVAGVPDPSIWTPELIITWTMMHWINGPYGAFSLYKNGAAVSKTRTSFGSTDGGPWKANIIYFFRTGRSRSKESIFFLMLSSLWPYHNSHTICGTGLLWIGPNGGEMSK